MWINLARCIANQPQGDEFPAFPQKTYALHKFEKKQRGRRFGAGGAMRTTEPRL
jgi:hypothetical protein